MVISQTFCRTGAQLKKLFDVKIAQNEIYIPFANNLSDKAHLPL